MLFHSLQFAIFFLIVYSLYLLLPHKWQNRMLLVASYVFYGSWDWRYLSLLMISTVVDFLCAINLEKTEDPAKRKKFVAISVFVNLSMLGVFKYYDFFAVSFQEMAASMGLRVDPILLNVVLPIGISFYTFQTISYTVDVYRKKVKACRDPLDFALYVSFFPQLIAGPIERGTRLLPQILNHRTVTLEKIYRGGYFFLWGLFLKVFIADNLANIADPVFSAAGPYEGSAVLVATYAFAIQIYCDFAGYSFMAIGLALAMGIDLMENFRRPYFSKNIADFWRRWHISLSSWFRDYFFAPLYIAMEKNKALGKYPIKVRHAIAFFATLLFTEYLLGLWHGAGWNFGFFGVYHALAIWAYYSTRKYWDRMNTFIQIILSFQIICGGWLVFRAPTLGQGWEMFKGLFTNFNIAANPELSDSVLKLFAFTSVLLFVQILQERHKETLVVLTWPGYVRYAFFALLGCLILVFGDFGGRPFIYFQF